MVSSRKRRAYHSFRIWDCTFIYCFNRKRSFKKHGKKYSENKISVPGSYQKLQAFGVVLPTESDKDKSDLLEKFKASRAQVIELIKVQDLDEICTRFEHPLFGFMTRREWIHFNMVHTNRHIDQIKELVVNFSKI